MHIHGNQGKEEDEPKVREAANQIRCAVCETLVVDLWNKTAGIDDDGGEDGRIVKTEDGILSLIEDTCRGKAPLFTQDHEVFMPKGENVFEFEFRPAPDGPSNWPAGVPKPLIMMNWATLSMRRACEDVITSTEVEIAELVYLGVNAKEETGIEVGHVVDEVCIDVTAACPTSRRKGKKGHARAKLAEFQHIHKGRKVKESQFTAEELEQQMAAEKARQVRKTPSWPRSWANFSLK
jgi:hypothetical protein